MRRRGDRRPPRPSATTNMARFAGRCASLTAPAISARPTTSWRWTPC